MVRATSSVSFFFSHFPPQAFERQLDSIIIRNQKLYLNKPRYRRSNTTMLVQEGRMKTGGRWLNDIESQRKRNNLKPKQIWREKSEQRTLKHWKEGANPKILIAVGRDEYSSKVRQTWVAWKKLHCWVQNSISLESLKDSFILNNTSYIQFRYLRDNAVLMTCEGDEDIQQSINQNREWLSPVFDLITDWGWKHYHQMNQLIKNRLDNQQVKTLSICRKTSTVRRLSP